MRAGNKLDNFSLVWKYWASLAHVEGCSLADNCQWVPFLCLLEGGRGERANHHKSFPGLFTPAISECILRNVSVCRKSFLLLKNGSKPDCLWQFPQDS